MKKSVPSWVLWGLIGLLAVVNLILTGAFGWQYRQNVRLRQQLDPVARNNTDNPALKNAYVKLYSDQDYKGEVFTVLPLRAPPDQAGVRGDVDFLVDVSPDNGASKDFNDKASSAIYFLPKGWTVVLFQDAHYKNTQLQLVGTGEAEKIPDFQNTEPPFNDKTTSLRWIQE
jgi:hypothetical protein